MTQEEAKYILEHTVLSWSVSGSDAREAIQMAIKELERKKGKWDFIGFQMFRCTACKHVFSQDSLEGWRTYTYEPTFPKFCPNCGAEMEQ